MSTVAVPRHLVALAINALFLQAHDTAGHSQAPDLISKDETQEWATAELLQKLLDSTPVSNEDPNTVAVKLHAYLPEWQLAYLSREDMKDPKKLVKALSFTTHEGILEGSALAGSVEVEVTLLPEDQIINNMVIGLRAKASGIRAKATEEATQIEGKINQLLAIENKPSGPNLKKV